MTAIANYFATVGFKTDNASINRVDRYLDRVEKRLERLTEKFRSSLVLNQAALNRTLGDSLDRASRSVVFQISRFHVDQINLQRALTRASRGLSVGVSPGGGGTGWDAQGRINLENIRHRNRMELEQLRMTNRAQLAGRAGVGAGIGAGMARSPVMGALMGYGAAGYLGYMGVRGIGAANRANQEMISARLTTQAVTEAAGLQGQGGRAFDWLRGESNRLGFSYMDQVGDYNSFLSNALGAGQNLTGAQNIYQGFAEYQRAMGITPARQKLVMSA